jgi:hypothetical protein
MSEVNGNEVLLWISKVSLTEAAPLLVGCQLDDGEYVHLLPIVDVDVSRNSLVIEYNGDRKSRPLAILRQGLVVDERPGTPLICEIDGSKSPMQKQLEDARKQLSQFHINPAQIANDDDVYIILNTLEDQQNTEIPSRDGREESYEALKRADLNRLGATIMDRWLKLSLDAGGRIEPDIYIKLTYFLRHSGSLNKALRTTGVLELPTSTFRPSQGERAVLSTMRGAILLDLYEANNDGDLLKQARAYAARAYAINQSDAVQMLYRRLAKLEEDFHRRELEISREQQFRRIADPDDVKAHK